MTFSRAHLTAYWLFLSLSIAIAVVMAPPTPSMVACPPPAIDLRTTQIPPDTHSTRLLQAQIYTSVQGYVASFEILYDTIIGARPELDVKIKEATKKFLIDPEINDWRPIFDDFFRLKLYEDTILVKKSEDYRERFKVYVYTFTRGGDKTLRNRSCVMARLGSIRLASLIELTNIGSGWARLINELLNGTRARLGLIH
ncbi:hypothetical protein LXL04_008251 [Taraxacum kok-saghyz]